MPSQKYTHGARDLRARQRIAEHFDLYDERAASRPSVTSSSGTSDVRAGSSAPTAATGSRAQFVAMGTGPLHRPKLPGIPGIETLRGPQLPHQPLGLRLHRRRLRTARRWTKLGRQARRHHRHRRHRGAVHPAPRARRQASCTCSSARRRRSTCATTTRSTPTGSPPSSPAGRSEWLMNFATLQTGGFADEDLVKDGWTDISQRIRDRMIARSTATGASSTAERSCRRAYEDSDDEKMERDPGARRRDRRATRQTAEALKPWYRQLCKRPCFHDEYLQAYNEPERAPRRHRRQGRRAHRRDRRVGRRRALRARLPRSSPRASRSAPSYARRSGFETIGRDGMTLSRAVGGRHASAARHPRPRLPEPVHRRPEPRGRT